MMKRASLFRQAKNSTYSVINPKAEHKTAATAVQHDTQSNNATSSKSSKRSRKKEEILAPNAVTATNQDVPERKLNFKNLAENRKPIPVNKQFFHPKNVESDGTREVARKKPPRAKVDLEQMKEELKQLEDPPETDQEKELSINRLKYQFYDTPCEDLAQNLLGKILVRQLDDGKILKARIVETESYLGEIDKASMTYQNRVTPRNIPMYMPPGTIFVYMTYGMYFCFNISSAGKGAAVLLRALDPLEGIEEMEVNRLTKRKTKKQEKTINLKPHELCAGPSKLCMAFQINKDHCKYSLCTWKRMWVEDDLNYPKENIKIIKSPRIGIDAAGPEWANKPLRYYIYGNTSVSKRDKKAEATVINNG